MIDLSKETRLTLAGAAKFASDEDGKAPHISTLTRWMFKGVRGVRLEHVRLGRKIFTTAEALNRFAAALADADHIPAATPTARRQPQSRREAEIEAAERYCAAKGI